MTAFGDITTSDHRDSFIDVKEKILLTRNIIAIPCPFDKNLQSLSLIAMKTYKKYLKLRITKKIEKRLQQFHKISFQRKLTIEKGKKINYIDQDIPRIKL